MVASIINGGQQQIPAANTFQPGEQTGAPKENLATQHENNRTTINNINQVAPGKTEQINEKVALSRDNTRLDPSEVSKSLNRGATLNITV